jgi:RNA-directed DNA polymerase
MSRWPSHSFRREAEGHLPEASIVAALNAAHNSQKHGLPAILTLNHLARHTRLEYRYLREIIERRRDPYRSFASRKRRGGYRSICVPEPKLMRLQRWLARHVLNKCPPHPLSFAYTPSRSMLDCAKVHVGARWLIKVDVRQFFESITEIQAYRVFSGIGYGKLVSHEMARLVTRSLRDAPGFGAGDRLVLMQ